ncbi:unnamed protein product [Paramecium sonneborni]|uniref:RING-type E3 ubiquitin transferase n=1 Tax=Paramecium sonneborni TaxID=65129 RepID=A0A8S1QCX7_9CILI|nr:unnamed protein product [Paramecium sonneborni]
MGQSSSSLLRNEPQEQYNRCQAAQDHWAKKYEKAQQKMESEVNEQDLMSLQGMSSIQYNEHQQQQQQKINQIDVNKELLNIDQSSSQEIIKQQIIQQQVEDEQIEEYFEKQINQPQNEIIHLSPEEVEHIWLSKIFKIDVNNQVINEKKVEFITKNKYLSVQYIIDELCYTLLTCSQFRESEKFEYLIEVLINITYVEIQEQFIKVCDGNIEKSKYYEILNNLQGQLITCILYPEGLEWEKYDEDPNRKDDNRNQRASFFYNKIFSSNQQEIQSGILHNLLDYINTKVSADDIQKFMDLMFKREFDLNANWSLDSLNQPLQTLNLLQIIAEYQNIMEIILLNSWAYGKFKLIQIGQQFQNYSIIGKILSGSLFYTDFLNEKNKFTGDYSTLTKEKDIYRIQIFNLNDEICNLFTKILKHKSNVLKMNFYTFISNIITLNLNLEKLFNQWLQLQCCTPGLIFNLHYILLKMFNPWIDDQNKIDLRIKNIQLQLFIVLKEHPLFSTIYQNIDLLAPDLIPLQELLEVETKIDPMTTMFLLTQRINHIVATNIDQFYYNGILIRQRDIAQQYGRESPQFNEILRKKLSFDTQILYPNTIKYTMQFLSFSSQLAMSMIDQNNKPKYPYGLLPSSFVNDTHSFFTVYNSNDEILKYSQELEKCCEFAIFAMDTRNITNPHLRIKGIELFHIFDQSKMNKRGILQPQSYDFIFRNNQVIKKHMIGGILKVFIDCERTGEGNQFYEKFNFRYQFCKLIRFLLEKHKDKYNLLLTQTVEREKEMFLTFANYYLNDMIFLLDECLTRMKKMKNLESQLQDMEQKQEYSKLQSELKTFTIFLQEYYKNIQVFSEVQPEAFLTDEIRDKLANNLNYTLEQLNGKQAVQYKIQSLESVNFDPKLIMGNVIELYINFSSNEKFLMQVVKDDRCFSIELFQATINLLGKHHIIPYQRILLFRELIIKLQEYEEKQKIINQLPDDVPDEFLDPLCYSLMTDPVKLPHSNVIVDRLTIKKQLLNQQIDPFDRTPLTIEMVIEQPELKQRIAKFIENLEKKKTNQQLKLYKKNIENNTVLQ